MSVFQIYLKPGLEHVADIRNYDHILFIATLFIVYPLSQWKKILLLLTAFTAGHIMALILASLKILSVSPGFVEFFFPALIFFSAIVNLFRKSEKFNPGIFKLKYLTASAFALIHGMSFSSHLAGLGQEENFFLPLLLYNIGIELGQMLIIFTFTALSLLFVDLLKVKSREWILFISGVAIGAALIMIADLLREYSVF